MRDNFIRNTLKVALVEKRIKQRQIVADTGLSEGRVSQLVNGDLKTGKNKKFDAWVQLYLDIDMNELRQKAEKEVAA